MQLVSTPDYQSLLDKAFGPNNSSNQKIIKVLPASSSNVASLDLKNASWMDIARTIQNDPPPSASAIITEWDKNLLYKPHVLASSPDYVLCKHCGRPTLVKVLQLHVDVCLERGAISTRAASPASSRKSPVKSGSNNTPLAAATGGSGSATNGIGVASAATNSVSEDGPSPRKRKIDGSLLTDDDSSSLTQKKPKKSAGRPGRKKKEKVDKEKEKDAKRALDKNKPVDVDKQCGVLLANGQLCARSLTCKTHSMGAKRAVPGRSAPYDVLLGQYQRRNQVKMASKNTAQQLADENEALASSVALSPEEEMRQVMDGVRKSNFAPLDQKVIVPTQSKKSFFRMREMLASALLPRSQGLGGIFGRAAAFQVDNPNSLHFVRPIARTTNPKHL